MAKMDDRMELIGSAILGQAQQEARALIDKANATRKKEISEFENEVVDGMFNKVQSKAGSLRQTSVRSIAKSRLDAHRGLLSHRSEKIGKVLDNVRGRLIDYANTEKYKDGVLKAAYELKDRYDHSDSIIMVAEKDIDFAREIKNVLGNGTVKADPDIKLGGFKLLNRKARVLIDETLDERLDGQKLWLLENCGLRVN